MAFSHIGSLAALLAEGEDCVRFCPRLSHEKRGDGLGIAGVIDPGLQRFMAKRMGATLVELARAMCRCRLVLGRLSA